MIKIFGTPEKKFPCLLLLLSDFLCVIPSPGSFLQSLELVDFGFCIWLADISALYQNSNGIRVGS